MRTRAVDLLPPMAGPSAALMAKSSFARASEILSTHGAVPAIKFTADALDVHKLATDLAHALETGAALSTIDTLAIALGAKCLDVQHRTLRARARGHR